MGLEKPKCLGCLFLCICFGFVFSFSFSFGRSKHGGSAHVGNSLLLCQVQRHEGEEGMSGAGQ